MARKKADADADIVSDLSNMDRFEAYMKKKHGNVLLTADDVHRRHSTTIPLGPVINRISGGGITSGNIVVANGKRKYGKTTLGLCAAAKAQQPEYGSRNVYYADVEGRLRGRNLSSIPGLITTRGRFCMIGSTEEKILSGEDFLDGIEAAIELDKGAFIIIDSVSALTNASQQADSSKIIRGGFGATFSNFMDRINNKIPVMDSILYCVTQQYSNVTGYGKAYKEKTPTSLDYYADFKFIAEKMEYWTVADSEDPIGQKVNWLCEFSALRGPGAKGESWIRYGMGIDEDKEWLEGAMELAIIQQSGKWYSYESDGISLKSDGAANLYKDFVNPDNAEARQQIINQVKEFWGI
jgi:recombination protein RecA